MAQTSRWMSLADASSRLGIPEFEVLDLAVSGRLHSRLDHDHRELCAADVDELAAELANKPKPTWKPWSAADHPEDRAEQDDA